jgi:hypothetical protein
MRRPAWSRVVALGRPSFIPKLIHVNRGQILVATHARPSRDLPPWLPPRSTRPPFWSCRSSCARLCASSLIFFTLLPSPRRASASGMATASWRRWSCRPSRRSCRAVRARVPWRRGNPEHTPHWLRRVVGGVPGSLRAAAPLQGGAALCGGLCTEPLPGCGRATADVRRGGCSGPRR